MGRLHRAARSGNAEEVAQYLAEGDAVDAISIHGFSALMLASREGNLAVVRQLLAAGASVDLTAPNPRRWRTTSKRTSRKGGRTALAFAASEGYLRIVRALVEHGANVDGGWETGDTPAISAAMSNHRAVVDYLYAHGADRERRGPLERTAEDWLALGGLAGAASVDFTDRPPSPEHRRRSEENVRKMMAEGLSADEYAAVHGRRIYVWGYGKRDVFDDAAVQAWAHRVAEILFTPGLLDDCEERFLQGDALDEARKFRARRAQGVARQKRREERKRHKKETA